MMSVQYLSNEKGQVKRFRFQLKNGTGLKVSILKVGDIDSTLPLWQEKLIDNRLEAIENDPSRINPITELMEELDK